MKKLTAVFTLAMTALAASAALPQPDLVAQIYFAGAQKISAAPNVNAFTNEFCSPKALALRTQTANKLSVWLAGWLQKNSRAVVPDGVTRLRPLFDDLQKSDWLLEARATAGGNPEVALAIRLDSARAQVWQSGLKPFLPAAGFTASGGWLIFDSGTGAPRLGTGLAQKISAPRPGWFSVDVNWPRLAQWFPELASLGLPETQFQVTAPDSSFRIDGKFFYPEPLALNLEAWRFPANLVHEPFISLTAVRGFASWLRSQAWAQPYLIAPTPNEAFVWALKGSPFQTFAAVPVPDAASALAQAYERLQPVFSNPNPQTFSMFKFSLLKTNNAVSLEGLPMLAPYVQSVTGPAGQYLFFGGFPNTSAFRNRAQLPPELFQRLATKNLVYYHWEITSDRVSSMLQPMQLGFLATGHVQLDGKSAAFNWLENTAPLLANTDTEITQTAADQLTFVRRAPGIFTSVELYALANWLEAKNFPGCDLRSPMRRIHRPHPAAAGVPPPAPAVK
jgi:hypothetical protein